MDLLECRRELDEIDSQIVALFEKRMEVCGQVAESKILSGKAVYDGEREKQKLASVTSMAHGDFNQTAVQELFSQMMAISRRYQYQLLARHGKGAELGFRRIDRICAKGARVVYQGVEGAYSHGAALHYFGEDADVYHVERFEDAMEEVRAGRADYAVLPIENSSAGAVVDMYDLLSRYSNYIVAETFLMQIGYIPKGYDPKTSATSIRDSIPYRLFMDFFMRNMGKAWSVEELAALLGTSKPTVYRHINKLKSMDLLESTDVEFDGQTRKGYRIRYGDLVKAWSFTEANIQMAMDNYRKTVAHFQELMDKRRYGDE